MELTLLTPLLVLILLFVVALGRLADARLTVNAAAHTAARAASIARDPATAAAAARATAQAALTERGLSCRALAVGTDASRFRPGGAVTVTVSCTVGLGDLAGLRLPGSQTVSARSTSPLDAYRGEARGFANSEGLLGANRRGGGR